MARSGLRVGAALVGLWLGSAPAEASTRVPGTTWRLSDSSDWTAQEVDALAEAAVGLPEALRRPLQTVHLSREAAPELPEDLSTPHTLVRHKARPFELKVGIVDLDAQVRAWSEGGTTEAVDLVELERHLLQRQLAHGLGHLLDEDQGWSQDRIFQALSGWSAKAPRKPGERDWLSYATVHGMGSVAEDVATMVEFMGAAAPLPGEPDLHPACRSRSKWRFLTEQHVLAGAAEATTSARCASLTEVGLGPDQVVRLELFHIQATASNPASVAGHLMLGVVRPASDSRPEHVDVYQLAAFPGQTKAGSLEYIAKGLSGLFASDVAMEPYWKTVIRYSGENREVTRLALRLHGDEEQRLLELLDDYRQGWDRSYLFFTRNCTHLPKDLLEWALEEDLNLPRVFGPDALLVAMDSRDRLEPVKPDNITEFSLSDRASVAEVEREQESRTLEGKLSADQARQWAEWTAEASTRKPARRTAAYQGVAEAVASWETLPPEEVTRWLVWSEEVERFRALKLHPDLKLPIQEALWKAQAEVAEVAARDNGAPMGDGGATSASLDRLRMAREERIESGAPSGHTGLFRLRLESGAVGNVDLGGAGLSVTEGLPMLSVGSALYDIRMGENRRFQSPVGIALRAFDWRVTVLGGEEPRMDTESTIFGIRRVFTNGPAGNLGFYATALHFVGGSYSRFQMDLIEAGPLLELFQLDQHRVQLAVSAGVLPVLRPPLPDVDRNLVQLETPLRVMARAGGKRAALTGLDLESSWRPVIGGGMGTFGGAVAGQLRLGALGGSDVALTGQLWAQGTAAGPSEAPDSPWSTRASLGLWVERF